MRFALVFLIALAATADVFAAECAVASDEITVEQREEMRRAAEAIELATRDVVVRLGEGLDAPRGPKPRPPWSYGRGDPTQPVAGSLGVRGATMAPFVKEFEVRDGDKTVTIRAMPTSTQEQVEQAYRRTKEIEARKPPLEKAIEAGDAATVTRLAATGAMRDKPKPQSGESWANRVMDSWRTRSAQAGSDMKRQAEVSRDHVAMLGAVLEGPGGDPSRDITTELIAKVPLRTQSGERVPRSIETVEMLLRRAPNVDVPLAMAAQNDERELLELMLRGRTPSQRALDGALMNAFQYHNWEIAVALLEAGADPNQAEPGYNISLLDRVLGPGWTVRPVVKAMIARKVNPNVDVRGGHTPLTMAIHDQELMAGFLANGADTRTKTKFEGETALHFAVSIAAPSTSNSNSAGFPQYRLSNAALRLQSTQLLLRYRADVNATDKSGRTPLMIARDAEVIRALLDAGGIVRPTGKDGPIGWALGQRNETLATELVKRNPEMARSDCSLIFRAAASGSASTVEALLSQGVSARIETADDYGDTPLISAARNGHTDVVALLLDRRAVNVNDRASPMMYPVDTLTGGGYIPLPLPEKAANALRKGTSYRSSEGQTALMAAAVAGRVDIVRLLLARGADVNAVDYNGRTALDYANANRYGNTAATALLIKEQGGTSGSK